VDETGEMGLPHQEALQAYMDLHYQQVTYEILRGEAGAELTAEIMRKTNCIATLGAYGRSDTSRFFHRSEADSLLRLSNIPLFITHP
ncbi:MAG TPA: universal stress protein, partial [Chitinophaga sp.]